ncbi:MAG: hypothetical protein CMD96_05930 [Gammaproteobacteria bacterium]|nr:hypothetical protein [Gammaproteobacteria bacterium]|tara:strand:+ start:5649 stop:6335 length:687 start_codon:yes stop_codon:yes gene_type:complete
MEIKEPTIGRVLHSIQKNLKAPKGQTNKFGGYKYRSCEDIVEAVKKLLPDGYYIKLNDELFLMGERHYIKAEASICVEQESITATAFAREAELKKGMDLAQLTGATSSYARKYALNGLFGIDDTKDADHESVSNPTEKSHYPAIRAASEKYKKDNTAKDVVPHVSSSDKEALFHQIEQIIDEKKITKGAITAIKKGVTKDSYPVGFTVPQMIKVRDKLLALKGYEEPF